MAYCTAKDADVEREPSMLRIRLPISQSRRRKMACVAAVFEVK
jgi:hypothetical protein